MLLRWNYGENLKYSKGIDWMVWCGCEYLKLDFKQKRFSRPDKLHSYAFKPQIQLRTAKHQTHVDISTKNNERKQFGHSLIQRETSCARSHPLFSLPSRCRSFCPLGEIESFPHIKPNQNYHLLFGLRKASQSPGMTSENTFFLFYLSLLDIGPAMTTICLCGR